MQTGFLYDPVFLNHDTGPGHPECKERLINTMAYLSRQSWFTEINLIESRTAELDQIEWVHSSEYIKRAQQT